jgi:hypothetical protein
VCFIDYQDCPNCPPIIGHRAVGQCGHLFIETLDNEVARGAYWARWYRYIKLSDGQEKRSPREKIITKELARNYRIGTEYEGPLSKADAQRVLDLLIV